MNKTLISLDFTDDEIASLPDKHCYLFMAALSGESYRELAYNFGLPIGTVKSRMFRAKAKLLENRKNAATANINSQ